MTAISHWGIQACWNFVPEKQIAKLMYYYLFQTWKYHIVYFDVLDINSCWKCLFAGDSTGRKFTQLPRLHIMILNSRGSNINLTETEHEGLEWVHLAQGCIQWLSPKNIVTHRFERAVTTVWWYSVLSLLALFIIWYTKLSDNGQQQKTQWDQNHES